MKIWSIPARKCRYSRNFVAIQVEHWAPVAAADLPRVRTGYERTFAHRVGRTYAGIADQDGKVTDIDPKAKLIEVTYKDGTRDIFEYGNKYTEFQGYFIDQDREINVKLNQQVKAGDVITYNKGFFNLDPHTGQLDMTSGVLANIALMETDSTLEDSVEISPSLSKRMLMRPVNMRTISLPKNSVVYSCKQVGDNVINTDVLMVFDEAPVESGDMFKNVDEATLSLIADMNRSKPTSKYNGKIVKMEAYSGCPISEMHPTLADIVRKADELDNRKNRFARGSLCEEEYPQNEIMREGSKYKGQAFDENTVVIVFYIQEDVTMDKGDKMVVANQLKCTVCSVMKDGTSTESGVPVDALFSAHGLTARVVLSPIFHGILSRCSEKVESDIVDMYFK